MAPRSASSAGRSDSQGSLDGSTVKCWEENTLGAIGSNTPANPVQSPTLVVTQAGTALNAVVDLQAGIAEFSLLRSDGTMWTWGYGFAEYAENDGITNVTAIGWAGPPGNSNGPRYLTSDGVYHNAMTNVPVNCNAM